MLLANGIVMVMFYSSPYTKVKRFALTIWEPRQNRGMLVNKNVSKTFPTGPYVRLLSMGVSLLEICLRK